MTKCVPLDLEFVKPEITVFFQHIRLQAALHNYKFHSCKDLRD